jgi:flagellar hook protein FlgE
MSFNTALSGIRAADTDLKVTGNNIANAGTIGFKGSRAQFGDVYTSSLLGGGSNTPGSGVTTLALRQGFDQGNLKFTQNALDMAVNGSGFL